MATMTFRRRWTLERDDQELDVTLEIVATSGLRATRFDPAEPAEFEIEARDEDGREVELTEAEHESLLVRCEEWAGEKWAEAVSAKAEARLDAMRDGD